MFDRRNIFRSGEGDKAVFLKIPQIKTFSKEKLILKIRIHRLIAKDTIQKNFRMLYTQIPR